MRKLNTAEWVLCAMTLLLAVMVACLIYLKSEIARLEKRIEEPTIVEKVVYKPVKRNTITRRDAWRERLVIRSIYAENDEIEAESGKIEEEEPFDYATDYVLRVLTAEAGDDEILCGCIAQALYNACERYDWQYAPREMMMLYKYTGPASWISDAAVKAYDDVFCSGVVYEGIGNATLFYAPQYCTSPWHESQRFVAEINGVRFFEEIQG